MATGYGGGGYGGGGYGGGLGGGYGGGHGGGYEIVSINLLQPLFYFVI